MRHLENIRVLILTEREEELKQLTAELAKSDLHLEIESTSRPLQFTKKLLRFKPDVVIATDLIKNYSGVEAYDDCRKVLPFAFFMLVSSDITGDASQRYSLSGIDAFMTQGSFSLLNLIVLQGFNKKHLEKNFYDSQLQTTERKNLMCSVFEHNDDAIFILDYRQEIIDLNPVAYEVLGEDPSEALIGADITGYLEKGDVKKFRSAHGAAFRGKKGSGDFTFQNAKKERRQAKINFIPIKNEDRVVTSVMTICRDVTEVYLFRQKLKMNVDRFNAFANQAPSAFYYLNPEGKCVYLNKKWIELTGLPYRECVGKGWLKAVHAEDREKLTVKLSHAVLPAEYTTTFRIVHTSGKIHTLYSKRVPFSDESGKIYGFIGTAIELTEDEKVVTADRTVTTMPRV